VWHCSHSARPEIISPREDTNNKLDSSWEEAYGPIVARKNQRHLVQKRNDDQMGSTPSGGPDLVVWTKPATPQNTNRGADGRVRVSDRD
jgi:hypothetical protein